MYFQEVTGVDLDLNQRKVFVSVRPCSSESFSWATSSPARSGHLRSSLIHRLLLILSGAVPDFQLNFWRFALLLIVIPFLGRVNWDCRVERRFIFPVFLFGFMLVSSGSGKFIRLRLVV